MSDIKKERKSNLLTIRVTDEDSSIIDYMSDNLGKSRSDAVSRACKYFLNIDEDRSRDNFNEERNRKEKKTKQLHLRMTDSDLNALTKLSDDIGVNISQVIRKAIKKYASVTKGRY